VWKSSKDRLIEFLQAELERQRGYVKEVQQQAALAELTRHTQEEAEHAMLSAEAISLCAEMIRLVPQDKANAETVDAKTGRPRSMSTYLQTLSDRSRKRAIEQKSLVAPGVRVVDAGIPAGVKVAGN
jgi:N-glycosylase/DNA lyase